MFYSCERYTLVFRGCCSIVAGEQGAGRGQPHHINSDQKRKWILSDSLPTVRARNLFQTYFSSHTSEIYFIALLIIIGLSKDIRFACTKIPNFKQQRWASVQTKIF